MWNSFLRLLPGLRPQDAPSHLVPRLGAHGGDVVEDGSGKGKVRQSDQGEGGRRDARTCFQGTQGQTPATRWL